MKKRFLFVVLGILLLQSRILAQSLCLTGENVPDRLASISSTQFIAGQPRYLVRVFLHFMRRSDGTGGHPLSSWSTALSILKNDFEAQNICISYVGYDEILNTAHYNRQDFSIDANGDGKFDNFSPNSHANAIDIYMFGTDANLQGGIAANIGATALAVGGTILGSNSTLSHVISHELGHCLGLFHTFHGLCEGGCKELVNGSNSATCGDFVADTPADNTKFNMNNTTCQYTGGNCGVGTKDANNQLYAPNPNLIMAYVSPSCMQYFTNGQGTRMRNIIANTPLLQNVTVPNALIVPNLSVSANSVLFDALNSINTNAVVFSDSKLILRAQNSITLTSVTNFNFGSIVSVSIDNLCSTTDQKNYAREDEAHVHDEHEHEEKPNVYPNPIHSGQLNFGETVATFELMNTSGKVVLEGKNVDHLDASVLSKGIYMLHLNSKVIKIAVE